MSLLRNVLTPERTAKREAAARRRADRDAAGAANIAAQKANRAAVESKRAAGPRKRSSPVQVLSSGEQAERARAASAPRRQHAAPILTGPQSRSDLSRKRREIGAIARELKDTTQPDEKLTAARRLKARV